MTAVSEFLVEHDEEAVVNGELNRQDPNLRAGFVRWPPGHIAERHWRWCEWRSIWGVVCDLGKPITSERM